MIKKKMISCVFALLSLSGCSLDYEDVSLRKEACNVVGGYAEVQVDVYGTAWDVLCKVDGVIYRVDSKGVLK